MREVLHTMNVKYMVPNHYLHLFLPTYIMRESVWDVFNRRRRKSYSNFRVNELYVTKDVAIPRVSVEVYRETWEEVDSTKHMAGKMQEKRPGFPTYLQAYTTNPSAVFMRSALVMQITENMARHRTEEVTLQVRYKKLQPARNKAEVASPASLSIREREI